MRVCSPKCKSFSVLSVAITVLVIGILAVVFWNSLFNIILKNELTLSNEGSQGYNMWKETPIPMYLDFYFFNWTNYKEVLDSNWGIKPAFEELGPYCYTEHHIRVNITWHDNGTLTYEQKRVWHFLPEKSNGSLSDQITNLNVIAATVAYIVRDKPRIVRKGVNFFLKEKEHSIVITRNVSQLLFDGYDDELLTMLNKLNTTGAINIPFDKFGWFYMRNASNTYDGNFTMFTGTTDLEKLGIIQRWNGRNRTQFYDSYCADVNGTSGELWPPVKDYAEVDIFAPDICSSLNLKLNGSEVLHGLEGKKFVADESALDNGTLYPERACFSVGEPVPTGVRNVSSCKFNAPAFVSFPHFYLADESYKTAVVGMKPNASLHDFSISLEPDTGIPLKVNARMQINILIQPIPDISFFANVNRTFMPLFWFHQYAELTPSLANLAKVVIVLPDVGSYLSYVITAVGGFILVVWLVVTWNKGWKESDGQQLLPQQSL